MLLLAAINAKYIHTNLALRYFRNMEPDRCRLIEYSINESAADIAADIFRTGLRDVLFSCYIWNRTTILAVCSILKKADPSFRIALGGPEVSYEAEAILQQNAQVDFILRGEGEPAYQPFLHALADGDFSQVPGLTYRREQQLFSNETDEPWSMDKLAFPYTPEELRSLQGRILYYESSRGCPYHCAFCLSSAGKGVRFMPEERAKQDLSRFIEDGVPLVKLVDRTFNADPDRALRLITFIKQQNGNTTFHFEVKAETLTEELLCALETARPGLFQLEIGVQSTNAGTLLRVGRPSDFSKISEAADRLRRAKTVHLHLDLIAGLPKESYASFQKSFNDVLALKPHNLQLGFLKRLAGSSLDTTGCAFMEEPPYEVIHSDAMDYADLLKLKSVEHILEKYYNSGVFPTTICYILKQYYQTSAFSFFEEMGEYFQKNGLYNRGISQKELYEILFRFCQKQFADRSITQRLIFDYCLYHRDTASFMPAADELKTKTFSFLKDKCKVEKYLPEYVSEKPTEIYKKIRIAKIGEKVYLFDAKKHVYKEITEDFS